MRWWSHAVEGLGSLSHQLEENHSEELSALPGLSVNEK